MIAPAHFDRDSFDTFTAAVADVLRAVAANRDLRSDADGDPAVTLTGSRLTPSLMRLDFDADFSGIGMPTNLPLTVVQAKETPDRLSWWFAGTLVATTGLDDPPEQAAATLDMNTLLDGFLRWATRGPGHGR